MDPWPVLGLDRLGCTQAIGGLALGLIALFSSYDHISCQRRDPGYEQRKMLPEWRMKSSRATSCG